MQVDVVELARGVVEGAAHFSRVNYDVLRAPNVRTRIDDGRNHLWLTPDRHDIVTADTIQPIHAGAGNLYSREYFELSKRVLRDGGVTVQWIGHREEQHYKLIMRTFFSVFPNTTLWHGGTLMVGSTRPLVLDEAAFLRKQASPPSKAALDAMGFKSFESLLGSYTAGPVEIRAFLGEGRVLTDDQPLTEYFLSLPQNDTPVDLSKVVGSPYRHVSRATASPSGN